MEALAVHNGAATEGAGDGPEAIGQARQGELEPEVEAVPEGRVPEAVERKRWGSLQSSSDRPACCCMMLARSSRRSSSTNITILATPLQPRLLVPP